MLFFFLLECGLWIDKGEEEGGGGGCCNNV